MSAPVEVGMRHVYFFITDCVLLEVKIRNVVVLMTRVFPYLLFG